MFGTAVNSLGKTEKNKKVKEGDCIFPFKYKYKTHSTCVKTEKGDICATSVNERGTLKTYGYCKDRKRKTLKKKLKTIAKVSQERTTMPVSAPYNDVFIDLLGKLEKIMSRKGEPMRARAYQKAQQSLMLYDKPINSVAELAPLKGIGKTMLSKFQEYIDTGKISAIEKEKNNPLILFTNIYGVGPKKADDLVKKGITTIEELRKNTGELNDKQKLGLQYYEDIEKRIPRAEIDDYKKVFSKIMREINYPGASMDIVGSYRRGVKDSGDIDIIMTDKGDNKELLRMFVDRLADKGILLHKLTDGKTKVLAIARLPGKTVARRVDFLYTPQTEYSFAILYFTGSKIFNTVMRQRALDMGYTLNEHGIYRMVSGKKGAKVGDEFPDEKSIFDFLDMKYKEPRERKDARAVETAGTKVKDIVEEKSGAKSKKSPLAHATPLKQAKGVKKTVKKRAVSSLALMREFTKKGKALLDTLSEKQLEDLLVKANDIYYNNPEKVVLSDEQFDIIKEYFADKFPEHPFLKVVGAPIIGKKDKVVLPFPMPSMDKIKPQTGALAKWLDRFSKPKSYVLSAKLDGTSGLYTTTDGVAKLYTRGDGLIGKDITHLIPFLKLPDINTSPAKPKTLAQLRKSFTLDDQDSDTFDEYVAKVRGKQRKPVTGMVLRGEFVISKDNFAKYFKGKGGKNARNTVAGLINTLVGSEDHKYIDFVGYEVMEPEMIPEKQMEFMDKKLNMQTVANKTVVALSNEILSDLLVDWRSSYRYEIDGVIVAHNKLYTERKNKNPEHAFAFKMVLSDQVAEAKVVDVLWSPSKDGYLKPRVQIEPVELGGVTITYATGKNAAFIKKNKIGVGAVVELVRSGDVIPDIKKVVLSAGEPLMPDVPYVWNETNVDIMLVDKSADETVREKNILGFFRALGVEGLGPGVVKKIMSAGYKSVPDILRMTEDDFLALDGFKDTMAHKIHTNIQNGIKDASLPLLMKASNIFGRGFGEKKLAPALKEIPDILISKESDALKIDKLITVDGWSTKTATEFVKHIKAFVAFLKECGLEDRALEKAKPAGSGTDLDTSHPLYRQKIVFSGFRPKELMEKIQNRGGVIASSVSKKTFAVIVKTLDEDTGKTQQARELGVSIMTPESFSTLYGL